LVQEAGDEVQMMKSGLMEIANICVVNKCDRPNAQTFVHHLKQIIIENSIAHTTQVIATIATEKEGIVELAQAIEQDHAGRKMGDKKKEMFLTKVMQLVIAQKMNQVDMTQVKTKLDLACKEANFNIFKFAQQFY